MDTLAPSRRICKPFCKLILFYKACCCNPDICCYCSTSSFFQPFFSHPCRISCDDFSHCSTDLLLPHLQQTCLHHLQSQLQVTFPALKHPPPPTFLHQQSPRWWQF